MDIQLYIPNEVYHNICNNIIKITDLRKMTQTSKFFNNICSKLIPKTIKSYEDIHGFIGFHIYTLKNFTCELILDDCCHFLDKKFYKNGNEQIIFIISAYVGNIEMLKFVYNNYEIRMDYMYSAFINAIISHNVDAIYYLCEIYNFNNKYKSLIYNKLLDFIKRNDNTKILDLLKKNMKSFGYWDSSGIIKNNKIHLVKWCMQNKFYMKYVDKETPYCKNLELLRSLHNYGYFVNFKDLYNEAKKNNSQDIIEWLESNNFL